MSSNNPNYRKLPTDQNQVANGYFPFGGASPGGVFSTDAVKNLITGKGFKARHYRYALNADRASLEGGVNVSSDSSRKGFVYYDPHDLFIVPQQLSLSDTYMQQGIYGNFQIATINHCANYADDPSIRTFLRANDILIADNDLSVLTEQLVEYNGRVQLRLMFPVMEVDYLADAHNRYYQGTDFTVCEGCIEWIQGGLKPRFTNGKGDILSVVYWTRPYFQVIATPRTFRALFVNQSGNPNQPSQLDYFPGSAVVKMLWSSRIDFDLPEWSNTDTPQQGMNIK